jgi:hypothetical protein
VRPTSWHVPWIADFQAAITSAASITENAHGYDWITRYRAYHRGQNGSPRGASFLTTPGAGHYRRRRPSPLTGSSCFGQNRRSRRKRATRTWRQSVAGSSNGSVTMIWPASGLRTAGITATRSGRSYDVEAVKSYRMQFSKSSLPRIPLDGPPGPAGRGGVQSLARRKPGARDRNRCPRLHWR